MNKLKVRCVYQGEVVYVKTLAEAHKLSPGILHRRLKISLRRERHGDSMLAVVGEKDLRPVNGIGGDAARRSAADLLSKKWISRPLVKSPVEVRQVNAS
jgi:hypothetical protein